MTWIKKSITRTIGLSFLVFLLVLFLIYFNLLNVQFKSYFQQESKNELIKDSHHISTEIEMFLNQYTVITQQAKNNPDFIQISKEIAKKDSKKSHPLYSSVKSQLADISSIDKNISLSYIALSNTNDLITDRYEYDTSSNFDLNKREWYQKTIQSSKTTISDPYTDIVTGKMTITVASPLFYNDEIVGVFGIDIMIEDIVKLMDQYKIETTGYAVLSCHSGHLITHPDYDTTDPTTTIYLSDLIGTKAHEVLSKEKNLTNYIFSNDKDIIACQPIPNTDLLIFIIVPKTEVFHQLNHFIVLNLFILLFLIVITILFIRFLYNFISMPVIKISNEIRNYSNNNQSISLPKKFLSRKDEIGTLSNGLVFMLNKISDSLLEIKSKNKELLTAKESISEERLLFKTTIHSLGDAVIATDNMGKISIMNVVAETLTGWSIQDAKGKDFNDVFHIINEFSRERLPSPVTKVLHFGKIIQLEDHTLLIKKNGQEIPIEDSAAPIKNEQGNIIGAVVVFRDFTEKKQKHDEIIYLSYHDYLTGLYNRRFFEERLKYLDVEENLPLSIAMLDANGLKLTNDAFGHQVGDELLKRIASILKDNCTEDDLIARIGGDEFIILFPKTSYKDACDIISRIYDCAEKAEFNNNIISISIGVKTKEHIETPIEDILLKAEENMYKKKIVESQNMRNRTIQLIFNTINKNNESERIHCKRVSEISKEIGRAMNFDENTLNEIAFAGLMHDIGKIVIPNRILDSPNELSESEYEEVKKHSEIGYQILRSVDEYSSLAENVLYHHERWDGKGYPRGLQGKDIPMIARIISVADAYEAMTSDRTYRKAMTHEYAIEELINNCGSQFDPNIVNVFVAFLSKEKL